MKVRVTSTYPVGVEDQDVNVIAGSREHARHIHQNDYPVIQFIAVRQAHCPAAVHIDREDQQPGVQQ